MKMTSLDPRFVCVRSFMEFDFLHAKVISHKKRKEKQLEDKFWTMESPGKETLNPGFIWSRKLTL